ncbi:MAG: hypothetical protein ACRCT1_22910 [Microcoleaceae cyanobacterium]
MTTVQAEINLPSLIDWLTHAQASSFLGIHESQYRRDLSLLHDLGIITRDKYAKGCDRETLETLSEFRQLAHQRGRKAACKEILRRQSNGSN